MATNHGGLLKDQIRLHQIDPLDGGHFSFKAFLLKIFDQLLHHNVFNGGLIEGVGRG